MNPFAHFPHSKNKNSVALFAVAMFAVGFGASGCDKLKARDELNKGVAAYRDGKYDQAIEFFKDAKDNDPTLTNARLYLATAYATQYIPGAPSDENVRMGEAAVKEFQDVLSADANNISAIDGIGSILFNMAGTPYTPDALRGIQDLPHEAHRPEAGRSRAVLLDRRHRLDAHLPREPGNARQPGASPIPASRSRTTIRCRPMFATTYTKENGQLIDEGINDLKKALELRPDYDDAMAYLNLLLRRKADEAATPDERASLLKQADDLVEKAKEIKQKKMETPAKP